MPVILSSRNLTLPEAREILEKRNEEGEMIDVQNRTLEYLQRFSRCDSNKVKPLLKDLEELGVEEEIAVNIVNIVPGNIDDLRTIVSAGEKTYTTDQLKKILSKLEEYCMKT